MSARLAPLVGADITHLYRTLRAEGAAFPGLHLQLDSDPSVVWQTGFELIRRAAAQMMPDTQVLSDRVNQLHCRVRVPALSGLTSYYECLSSEIRFRYNRYRCPPVTMNFYRLPFYQCIELLLEAQEPALYWYCDGFSLCKLWRDLRAVLEEIRHADTSQHAAAAQRARQQA